MRRRGWAGATDNITPEPTIAFLRDSSWNSYSTQEHGVAGVFSQ
jgi:hypothetical protein